MFHYEATYFLFNFGRVIFDQKTDLEDFTFFSASQLTDDDKSSSDEGALLLLIYRVPGMCRYPKDSKYSKG